MKLEFFADDDEVERLEAQLAAAGEARTVNLLLPLAWQVRQRDPPRALTLADEVEIKLSSAGLSGTEQSSALARLHLIRAEVHWLHGDLHLAQPPLDAALASFAALGDAIGTGDGEWLAAFVCFGRGDPAQRDAFLLLAQDHYAAARDSTRLAAAQARFVFYAAFTDPVAARLQWQALSTSQLPEHPLVEGWMYAAEGVIEGLSGNLYAPARALLRGYESMSRCGGHMHAANCAANAGSSFASLNDLASALKWGERALALARKVGSPAQTAGVCSHIANALLLLKRPGEAQIRLQEAREALAHLPPAHPINVNVLAALAELALEVGDAVAALEWAEQCELRAIAARMREQQKTALCCQARALGHMGRPDEALSKVDAALVMGQEIGNTNWQMEALRVLAELHRQHPLPDPIDLRAPSAALHYLEQALALARGIEGFLLPPALLDEAAADYASVGEAKKAYALSVESKQALLRMHSREATDRAIAMQVQGEMELMQAEMANNRKLKQAENSRLAVLEQANATLEGLGTIGREITASLNAQAVFEALHRHVQGMLDAFAFLVYFVDTACEHQTLAFGIEGGQAIKPFARELGADSVDLRCIRERDAVVVAWASGALPPIHGTDECRSAMFAPLMVGERVLGILTIQSPRPGAYGEREVAIFKSLTAYGAIALANAQAMDSLKKTQSLLVQQEKLASLGSMVAGISHELNTPIGNALVMSTTLEHNINAISREVGVGPLKRSRLDSFLATGLETSGLVTKSLQRATTLIAGFKQVAVDQTSEERRRFDLRSLIEDSTLALRALCADQLIHVVNEVPLGIECDTFPGPLSVVLGSIIQNCRAHAFNNEADKAVSIRCRTQGDRIFLEVVDNGVGMSAHVLAHVFDPFFTTKLGQGGSGIGLSVAHRLATHVLAGDLSAASAPGKGSTFTLNFPKRAPFAL